MAKGRQTRAERMQGRSGLFFAGREEHTNVFKSMLEAVKQDFIPPYDDSKTVIAIHGEGGMGKTALLTEFRRICKEHDIESIYLEMARIDEPINTLVDFMRVARRWFRLSRVQRTIGKEPFADFDAVFLRLMALEREMKAFESGEQKSPSAIDVVSETGSRLAVGLSKDLPLGQTAVTLVGEERLQQSVEWALEKTLSFGHERLLRILKPQDLEFYLSHEETLIEKFALGVANYTSDKPLVILIDTYEQARTMDIHLRERLLGQFPDNVLLVFAGRNSIYDNCDPNWRDETHFFELREFILPETLDCLRKRQIEDEELATLVQQFTLGVPLAVVTVADIVKRVGPAEASRLLQEDGSEDRYEWGRQRIIEEVTDRFLSLVHADERRVIEACAVLTTFDKERLEAVLGHTLSQEQFGQLETYSFVRQPGRKYFIHEVVRAYILADLAITDPSTYFKLHTAAADYFDRQRSSLTVDHDPYENEKWRELTLEMAYHRLRSDKKTGLSAFYQLWAGACWENDHKYAGNLVEVASWVPTVQALPALELKRVHQGFSEQDYLDAKNSLESLLGKAHEDSYFRQTILDLLGEIHSPSYLNRPREAIDYFQRANQAFAASREYHRATLTLVNISHCYRELGSYKEAIQVCQQAFVQAEQQKEPVTAARILVKKAQIYRQWGKLPEAISSLQDAVERFIGLEERDRYADALWELGITERERGDYAASVTYLGESREVYQSLERQVNVASILWWLGITERERGDYAASVTYLEESRELYNELEQPLNVAHLWQHLGITYRNWGKYEAAREAYKEAQQRFEALERQVDVADVLLGLGITEQERGDYAASVTYLEESRELYNELEQPLNVARLWNSLGITYGNWGKYEAAREAYKEAQQRFEALEQKVDLIDVFRRLGQLERQHGNIDQSMSVLEKNFQLASQLQIYDEMVNIRRHQALTLIRAGEFKEAEKLALTALAIAEEHDLLERSAWCLETLVEVYGEWGQAGTAREYGERALKAYGVLGQHDKDKAEVKVQLGRAEFISGNPKAAIEHLKTAFQTYLAYNQFVDIARTKRELSRVYAEQGNHQEAKVLLEESLITFQQLGIEYEIKKTQEVLSA